MHIRIEGICVGPTCISSSAFGSRQEPSTGTTGITKQSVCLAAPSRLEEARLAVIAYRTMIHDTEASAAHALTKRDPVPEMDPGGKRRLEPGIGEQVLRDRGMSALMVPPGMRPSEVSFPLVGQHQCETARTDRRLGVYA